MKLQWTRVLIVLVTASLLVVGAFAQGGGQGSVEGTVTDASGAVVPGVTLTLKNIDTGLSFTAASNDTGYFHFPVVPVGRYDFSAASKSFAGYTQKGVSVSIGSKVNLPISLSLAAQKENVEVTSELP